MKTDLDVQEVLEKIQKIEAELERTRERKWHARTLDIDIIFYDDQVIENEILTVPHRHLHERNFVLIPLSEIAPKFRHPVLKKSIEQLVEASSDDKEVVILAH